CSAPAVGFWNIRVNSPGSDVDGAVVRGTFQMPALPSMSSEELGLDLLANCRSSHLRTSWHSIRDSQTMYNVPSRSPANKSSETPPLRNSDLASSARSGFAGEDVDRDRKT